MDEPLPGLEDLLREIREIPSPEVRLAGLAVTRKVIEQQLDISRRSELLKLQQQHVRDQTHEEDAALDMYELEVQVTHLLPKVLRGGFLLLLWSTLEACTKDLAVYASRQTGRALPNGLFRHSSFIESSEQAFASVLDIKAYETFDEREALARLAKVRAALVHHNGNVEALPEDLKNGNRLALESEGLNLEQDLHHRYFVATEEYVERHFVLVDRHLRGLSSRVRKKLRSFRSGDT